jgi:hypothetical protein
MIVIGIGKPPPPTEFVAACPFKEVAILLAILCFKGVF